MLFTKLEDSWVSSRDGIEFEFASLLLAADRYDVMPLLGLVFCSTIVHVHCLEGVVMPVHWLEGIDVIFFQFFSVSILAFFWLGSISGGLRLQIAHLSCAVGWGDLSFVCLI